MERWLTSTVASMGDGVITTNRAGPVTLTNDVAQRLTGWNQDDARGRPFSEVFRVVDDCTNEPLPNLIERAVDLGRVAAGGLSRLRWASLLLGFSLGGFLDGILLHQVLQWHHR